MFNFSYEQETNWNGQLARVHTATQTDSSGNSATLAPQYKQHTSDVSVAPAATRNALGLRWQTVNSLRFSFFFFFHVVCDVMLVSLRCDIIRYALSYL